MLTPSQLSFYHRVVSLLQGYVIPGSITITKDMYQP